MSIATRIEAIEEHIGDIYDTLTLGGADLTGVNKNLVNVTSQLKDRYIDYMNNGTWGIWNNWEKVTGEGTSLSLSPTIQAPMKNNLKGNTSQTGTPTPSSPIPVNVVSGNNEIEVCGKNLYDKSQELVNTIINSVGNAGTDNNFCASGFLAMGGNQTITISSNPSSILIIAEYNSGKTFIKRNIISNPQGNTYKYTITTDNNTHFVRICYSSTSTTIQLEKSNQATSYEPYQGNTYNIDLPSGMELCKIGNYQDYFYKDSGKWYKYAMVGKATFTGANDETWVLVSTQTNTIRVYIEISDITDGLTDTTQPKFLDNYFNPTTFINIYNNDVEAMAQYGGTNDSYRKRLFVRISKSSATTVADFKTWLSTHNLNVYYELSTPTTTEITYQPLIEQLEALYNAMSKDGQTNISQINNDLPFIINSTMLKEV